MVPAIIEQSNGTEKVDARAILMLHIQVGRDSKPIAFEVKRLAAHEDVLPIARQKCPGWPRAS